MEEAAPEGSRSAAGRGGASEARQTAERKAEPRLWDKNFTLVVGTVPS